MPLAPTPPEGCPFFDGSMYLLATMGDFRCPQHFSSRVINRSQAADLATRVDFEAQGPHNGIWTSIPQYQRKGIAAQDRRSVLPE
jgi:hypothetical protein